VNLFSDRLSYLASRVAFDISRPRTVEGLVYIMESCELLLTTEVHLIVYESREFTLINVLAAKCSYCRKSRSITYCYYASFYPNVSEKAVENLK
jgi:hypothetical protein